MTTSPEFQFSHECELNKCAFSRRHFGRDNTIQLSNTDDNDDPLINLYNLEMDNLHFNFLHLFQSGFRVNYDEETETTDDSDINGRFLRTARFVMDKRDSFNRFKSSQQTVNKYNRNIDISKSSETTTNGQTFCDSLLEFICKDDKIERSNIEQMIRYMIDEQFESDTIIDDFEDIMFYTVNNNKDVWKQSNFYL